MRVVKSGSELRAEVEKRVSILKCAAKAASARARTLTSGRELRYTHKSSMTVKEDTNELED